MRPLILLSGYTWNTRHLSFFKRPVECCVLGCFEDLLRGLRFFRAIELGLGRIFRNMRSCFHCPALKRLTDTCQQGARACMVGVTGEKGA